MGQTTSWDANVGQFDVHSGADRHEVDLATLEFGVAANIVFAWSGIQELLQQKRRELDRSLHIVDFGCGTGGFTQACDDFDDVVTGIDISAKMIETARSKTCRHIQFLQGDIASLGYFPHQDVVVANLVTNYLASIEDFGRTVSRVLDAGGSLFFADLNPQYVRECLKRGVIYSDPDPVDNPRYAILNFADGAKRITIWEPEDYKLAFARFGLEFCSLSRPPLSPEFLERFSNQLDPQYPKELPRYGIYAFRRT